MTAQVPGSTPASLAARPGVGDGLAFRPIALVRERSTARLYIDGAEVANAPWAGPTTPASTFQVGPGSAGPDVAAMLLSLDEVRLSDVPRTPQEISQAALVRQRVQNAGRVAVPAALGALPQILPEGLAPAQKQVELGSRLFSDTRLSVDSSLSCASCHDPARHYTDGRTTSIGRGGVAMRRNTPGLHNRLFGEEQGMDGAATSIEHQIERVFSNPVELGWSADRAAERLRGIAEYATPFNEAFGIAATAITGEHVTRALAAFNRSLVSGNARADRGQLTPEEQRGRGLFFGKARCAMCHDGPNFTDEGYHAVGLRDSLDTGRMAFTGRPGDRGKLRTPTLRDVARTAPYFHDGRKATLEDVVSFYNSGGDAGAPRDIAIQPLGLTAGEQAELVAFLRALNGEGLSPEGPTPELVRGGTGCASGNCLWLLGANHGDDAEVLISTRREAAPRAIYRNPGRPGAAAPCYARGRGAGPAGWAGTWDSITLEITSSDLISALRSGGVWVKIRRGSRTSEPYRIF